MYVPVCLPISVSVCVCGRVQKMPLLFPTLLCDSPTSGTTLFSSQSLSTFWSSGWYHRTCCSSRQSKRDADALPWDAATVRSMAAAFTMRLSEQYTGGSISSRMNARMSLWVGRGEDEGVSGSARIVSRKDGRTRCAINAQHQA